MITHLHWNFTRTLEFKHTHMPKIATGLKKKKIAQPLTLLQTLGHNRFQTWNFKSKPVFFHCVSVSFTPTIQASLKWQIWRTVASFPRYAVFTHFRCKNTWVLAKGTVLNPKIFFYTPWFILWRIKLLACSSEFQTFPFSREIFCDPNCRKNSCSTSPIYIHSQIL